MPLPLTTSELGPIMEHAIILEMRFILRDSRLFPHVLISWMGLDHTISTWEDKADMDLTYPNFNLEGKVIFNGGGIASLPINKEVPHHVESENVAIQEGIKYVSDPEIVEARCSQKTKYPSIRSRWYKTN